MGLLQRAESLSPGFADPVHPDRKIHVLQAYEALIEADKVGSEHKIALAEMTKKYEKSKILKKQLKQTSDELAEKRQILDDIFRNIRRDVPTEHQTSHVVSVLSVHNELVEKLGGIDLIAKVDELRATADKTEVAKALKTKI